MSKLDEIEYETYLATPPQNEDGSYKKITDKTRQQLKDLMLELVGDDEEPGRTMGPGMPSFQRDLLRRELRRKISEL